MKTKVLALLGVLIVAGGVTFGINTALGDPPAPQTIPKEPKPESTPEPPPTTPAVANTTEIPPRDLVCVPGSFVPVAAPLHANVNGKAIPLPGAIVYQMDGIRPGDSMAKTFGVYSGRSWVRFTADGVLLESHIEPEDAGVLNPLVNDLKQLAAEATPIYGHAKRTAPRITFSGDPSDEDAVQSPSDLACVPNANMPVPLETVPSVTINGEHIPMPPGTVLTSVLPEPGPGFSIIYYRNSWVKFQGDALLESHIEPQDQEALAPLLNELKP